MAEKAQERTSAERNVVHCLLCKKPQRNIAAHLQRVCLKGGSPEERAAEVQRAKKSSRDWVWENRTWDYHHLCEVLPHRSCRLQLVKLFQQRGFLLTNLPHESDMVEETAVVSGPPIPLAASAVPSPTGGSAASPSSSSFSPGQSDSDQVSSSDQHEGTRDPSWQREGPSVTTSVRIKMKEAGLYEKFPDDCPLLRDFKKYLRESLKVPNCQQEVDNVSRFLRFVQPSGDEPTLDFLTKSTETRDFLTRLHHTTMTAATMLNYIKNIIMFLDYLRTRLDLGLRDAQLREKCQAYKEMLQTLRKPISKAHSQEVCKTRYTNFVEGSRSVAQCQEVLRVANRDFLTVYGKFISDAVVTETEKTMYRYYCEAVMVLGQFQRLGAVEGMTETEWVNRKHVDGHCVIAISKHETATQQIASFTLNQEEEAWFQEYFEKIRPTYLTEYCERFFIATNGKPIHSVTNDISCLHESYKLKPVTSQEVPDTKDFSKFLVTFPVTTEGQPPTKKARTEKGFPGDRTFYDKWRYEQYRMRQDSLLLSFTHRKPTVGKVSRATEKEGWTANYPSPDTFLQLWKPASKVIIEKDPAILKSVSRQTWRGLAVKDFGPGKGLGVVATRPFSKGDIVCDYHGKVITAEEGRALMQSMVDEAGYLFFFKAGGRDLCIDAQTFPCECHPDADTIGRRMNHSRKKHNLKPVHCTLQMEGEDREVIFFRALKDIPVDQELKFDYGVSRKSFRGEGLELDWLDE